MSTEVTEQGWFSRIGGAIKGVVIGGILFIAGFPVLYKNEQNSVQNIRTIEEAKKNAVTVDGASVDATREGALVHLTGEATPADTLTDEAFGVSSKAIRLSRQVEMYQWVEKKETDKKVKAGGKEETRTTYTYKLDWDTGRNDSSDFHDKGYDNPEPAYDSLEKQAENVSIKAYKLSPSLVSQYSDEKPLPVKPADLPADLASKFTTDAKGNLYLGKDPAKPVLGDLRIAFTHHLAGPASVIARQVGGELAGYASKSDKTVEWLYNGVHGIAEICGFKAKENAFWTWLLRGGGFLLMWVGLGLVLRPLKVLGDVLPWIGTAIGYGLGMITGLVAFVLATVTIAVAWIAVRPLAAIPAIAAIVMLVLFMRKKKAAAAAAGGFAPPPPPPPPA